MDNKPTYLVYHIADRDQDNGEEKNGFWTKVGAAWPHKDGKGFNLFVDMLPLDGRLVLREPLEEKEQLATVEQNEPAPVAGE